MEGECHYHTLPKDWNRLWFWTLQWCRGWKTLTQSFLLLTGLQCPTLGKRYIVSFIYELASSLGRKKGRCTPQKHCCLD